MQTAFNKNEIQISSGYIVYGRDRRFIARLKYNPRAAKGFAKFVADNFTVEEYFGRMEAGEAPLTVVESKGYVSPHIKRWLKERGLPQTQEGKRMMLEQDRQRRTVNA